MHCGLPLERETKTHIIINSVWGIIGGLVLILLDTDMVLSLGHVIPIPYGLSLVGVGTILYSSENIINCVMPDSLLWSDPAELSVQATIDNPYLLKAIIFGLIAGIISAGTWYEIATVTKYHFGIFAIIVGWLIGKFVAIGSRQRKELSLQVMSVLMSLSILLLTEYFIMHYFFIQSLSQKEFSSLPIFLPLDTTLSLLSEVWKNEPISILFWIVSLGLAFAVPGGLYINKPFSKTNPKEVKQFP